MKGRILAVITCILLLTTGTPAQSKVAIKGGKIVTVSGEVIENGMILIEGSMIAKIGKDITIPDGTKVFDYPDKMIYPGLISPVSSLGLSGIAMIRQVNDTTEPGKFNPEVSSFSAFYSWSNLIPNARDFGITTVMAVPSGGRISGKGVLASMNGWTPEDMFIRKEAALIVRFPGSTRSRGGSRDKKKKDDSSKEIKELREFFNKAHKYHLRREKYAAAEYNGKYEAMRAVWKNKLPVIISVVKSKDIKKAIQMAKDFSLNAILQNIYEGESVTKEIKESGYPVILDSMYQTNREWEDGCDKVFRLPAALHKAGIKFAFSQSRSATAFDLPIQASRAVAYGLPRDAAVRGLTLWPAQILGLKGYGALEEGYTADIIVTDGCILETSTRVLALFIQGKPVTGKSYFTKEYLRAKEKISGELK